MGSFTGCFFKSPTLCILRTEVSALVTISNVWTSEENKKCLVDALCCGFNGNMSRRIDEYYSLTSVPPWSENSIFCRGSSDPVKSICHWLVDSSQGTKPHQLYRQCHIFPHKIN